MVNPSSWVASAEREAICLDAGIEELDLEGALRDRPGLADQLIRALVPDDPLATGLDVAPVGTARDLAVEIDPERDRGAPCGGAHDEVEVAGVEPEGDPSAGFVQDRGVPSDRPGPREVPVVER